MRLTTKGRFAVTAMLDVALYGQAQPVSLTAISERQNISLSYLEQLFGKLRRAELVNSVRGPGGGYILAKAADQINIAQIVAAAEDKLDATQCHGTATCNRGSPCLTHQLWENLNQTIDAYLRGITLEQILQERTQRQTQQTQTVSLTHIH